MVRLVGLLLLLAMRTQQIFQSAQPFSTGRTGSNMFWDYLSEFKRLLALFSIIAIVFYGEKPPFIWSSWLFWLLNHSQLGPAARTHHFPWCSASEQRYMYLHNVSCSRSDLRNLNTSSLDWLLIDVLFINGAKSNLEFLLRPICVHLVIYQMRILKNRQKGGSPRYGHKWSLLKCDFLYVKFPLTWASQ